MATNISEGFPRQDATIDARGSRYARFFQVEAVSEADALDQLDVHYGIRYGATYVNYRGESPDPAAVATAFVSRPLTQIPSGGTGLFAVSIYYEYPSGTLRPPSTIYNGPDYRMERTLVEIQADTDIDGNPITNAADEVYDPPATITAIQRTLVIEWAKIGPDYFTVEGQLSAYLNKVNSATYRGGAPRTLKCVEMTVSANPIPYISGLRMYRVTTRIQSAEMIRVKNLGVPTDYPGWDLVKPNIGRRIKDAFNGQYINLREGASPYDLASEDGYIASPVHLNPAGSSTVTDPLEFNYRTFQMFNTIDFNGLGV